MTEVDFEPIQPSQSNLKSWGKVFGGLSGGITLYQGMQELKKQLPNELGEKVEGYLSNDAKAAVAYVVKEYQDKRADAMLKAGAAPGRGTAPNLTEHGKRQLEAQLKRLEGERDYSLALVIQKDLTRNTSNRDLVEREETLSKTANALRQKGDQLFKEADRIMQPRSNPGRADSNLTPEEERYASLIFDEFQGLDSSSHGQHGFVMAVGKVMEKDAGFCAFVKENPESADKLVTLVEEVIKEAALQHKQAVDLSRGSAPELV